MEQKFNWKKRHAFTRKNLRNFSKNSNTVNTFVRFIFQRFRSARFVQSCLENGKNVSFLQKPECKMNDVEYKTNDVARETSLRTSTIFNSSERVYVYVIDDSRCDY